MLIVATLLSSAIQTSRSRRCAEFRLGNEKGPDLMGPLIRDLA